MDQEKTSLKWDPLTITLGIAAIFAIGSIGFFLATYLESLTTPSTVGTIPVNATLTEAQKDQVMAALQSTSTASSGATTSTSSKSGLSTAAKLKILEGLNAQ